MLSIFSGFISLPFYIIDIPWWLQKVSAIIIYKKGRKDDLMNYPYLCAGENHGAGTPGSYANMEEREVIQDKPSPRAYPA